MLVGIEFLALGGDAGDSVAGEHIVQFARGGLDPGEKICGGLVGAQFVRHGGQRAVEIVLDREHVAGETGRGIIGRLDFLGLQTAADILGIGGGVERLGRQILDLPLELGDTVMLGQFGRGGRSLGADIFGFVVEIFVHCINLVSA